MRKLTPVRGVVMVVILILSVFGANSAFAHAQLTKSSPENKASLKESPTNVDLWFNELLDDGFNTVEVYSASELNAKQHTSLVTGEPKVDSASHNHLVVTLKALKPGDYIVDYRVLSRDGHTAPGRITFTILGPK
ncbi:MAG TPA: copper resistance CopC family protein [Verrucomicrobiae bacterium]|jgi:methionine-rich copper-binding protein CopC|nr:copper resistance CopC family protein [Verrucomicrobiae bacterium]